MRVLFAPDCFTGTLTAAQAAGAMAAGWRERAPADDLDLAPMSDGGPGLVEVLSLALPDALTRSSTVTDPLGRPVQARWLLDPAGPGTAYLESAQAAGLHLLTPAERQPGRTTTYGVGQLLLAALDEGAGRVVVGLGGSATNDGGAGALEALGLASWDDADDRLPPGGAALARLARLSGRPDPRLAAVELLMASDVDSPLLGLYGASAVFGPQKGAGREQVAQLDGALTRWADVLEATLGVEVRGLPGSGAAGGLGAALYAVGATRTPGIELVHRLVDLPARVAAADLVLTGEGSLDASSLAGKVVAGVAALAAAHAVPCVVLAGRVQVGRREAAAHGIDSEHSLVDAVGLERALAEPEQALRGLAAHVAGQWSH